MCLLIILFSILINQNPNISVKEKQTARSENVRESYTHQNTQIHTPRIYIVLYYNEGTIDYNQQFRSLHIKKKQYKQFPQHRKNLKKERERGKERKRKCEREGKRDGKEKEKEKEREEERGRKEKEKKKEEEEEEKIEKAVLKKVLL